MPIQQMLLGAGASGKKTYVDDVFSTFLYKGNGTSTGDTQTINNGIDLSGEGGMVWLKSRDSGSYWHTVVDTVRGANKTVYPNDSWEGETLTNVVNSFNNNGFTAAYNSSYSGVFANKNNDNVASWTFRKAPGFFDVVTYTGSGNVQSISHSLGSVPGMIIIKRTDASADWYVWHRYDSGKYLKLNSSTSAATNSGNQYFGTTFNSTHFSVGHDSNVNGSGGSYVAYVFAGGESTAATARSVGFSSSSTYLSIPDSNDFDFGSTFTFEAWVKPEFHSGGNNLIFEHGSFQIAITDAGRLNFDLNHVHISGDFYSSAGSVPEGQWTHVAVVGTSGTLKMYINGVNDQNANRTDVDITGDTGAVTISDSTGYYFKGEISNLRIVKGTAVYASSFRPPTEPLTNITNTVLLCCNNSSTTGSTVTPGTITANGSPTAETDSPFDDPAGFVFGDAGDQNLIKCGSHSNSATENIRIYTGWEPQWVMTKNASVSSNWGMFDCMRGIFVDSDGSSLVADSSAAENGVLGSNKFVIPHGDGFSLKYGGTAVNPGNGNNIIYIAIRRTDGYVGKLPELGTDAFAMAVANGSTPSFISNFPVDWALMRMPNTANNWSSSGRLAPPDLQPDNSNEEDTSMNSVFKFDHNNGWAVNRSSPRQSWMWKRHAGFDVVTYTGNGVAGREISHSLNKTPEMMWLKNRSNSRVWAVYHKDLGGSDPAYAFWLELQDDNPQQPSSYSSGDTGQFYRAPSATHFSVNGPHNKVNADGDNYIAMLFASTDVSAVGSYTGNGNGSSGITTTTGFQPRFLIIKRIDGGDADYPWWVMDSLRGMSNSGDEKLLKLNSSAAQVSDNIGDTSSTGFTITSTSATFNANGGKYLYYAHA